DGIRDATVTGVQTCALPIFEVGDDLVDGAEEAVQIQAVEARLPQRVAGNDIALPQPSDEVEDHGVAPHPCGEALKAAQSLLGGEIGRASCREREGRWVRVRG